MKKYTLGNRYILGNWDEKRSCFDESISPELDSTGMLMVDTKLEAFLHHLENQYNLTSEDGPIIIPRTSPKHIISKGYGLNLTLPKTTSDVVKVKGGMWPYVDVDSTDIGFNATVYLQSLEDLISAHNEVQNTLPWE